MPENVEGEAFYERLVEYVHAGRHVGVCLIEHPKHDDHIAVFASVIPISKSARLMRIAYESDMTWRACMAIAAIGRARDSARKMQFTPLP